MVSFSIDLQLSAQIHIDLKQLHRPWHYVMEDAWPPGLVQLLDVLPQHRVLDINGTCSPDLAKALHGSQDQVPQGLLIANARPEMLETLCATVPQKFWSCIVFTGCQPQSFPQLFTSKYSAGTAQEHEEHKEHSSTAKPTELPEVREVVLKFDRVLCGVTCSQSSQRHQPWHMHPLQLRTLQRGLQSLAPGGKLLYLTKGGAEIENEAVVAACLSSQASELQVHLIPVCHDWLTVSGWSTLGGHLSWEVPSPHRSFSSWDEVPHKLRGGKILQTMFPPTETAELRKCFSAFWAA